MLAKQKKGTDRKPKGQKAGSRSAKRSKQVRKQQGDIVYAPMGLSRRMRTGVPDVSGSPYTGDGRVRIKHREYIRDIYGSVAFSAQSLSVNPGLAVIFPWLSSVAQQFESYLFRKLDFHFETQKSASTSGSVMMSVDFDAADSLPVNKQQLMAFHNAVRSAVWDECRYRGDVRDLKKFGVQRYIRSGNLAANLDIKTYDVGNLIVGTQGEADTTAIGELYVEYDVELITPQVNVDLAGANSVDIHTSAASLAAPFTGTQVVTGGLDVTASGATLTFNQPGQYLVLVSEIGTVITDTPPTLSGTATVSAAFVNVANFHTTAATSGMCAFEVNVTDRGQTVVFDFTATATTITTSAVRIAPYGFSNL